MSTYERANIARFIGVAPSQMSPRRVTLCGTGPPIGPSNGAMMDTTTLTLLGLWLLPSLGAVIIGVCLLRHNYNCLDDREIRRRKAFVSALEKKGDHS